MCVNVTLKETGQHVATVGQLRYAIGADKVRSDTGRPLGSDLCLCCVDMTFAAEQAGYEVDPQSPTSMDLIWRKRATN